MPRSRLVSKGISKKYKTRTSSGSLTQDLPPATPARDPQQLPYEILRANESFQINQDNAPEHLHVPDMVKIKHVDSSSSSTTELTYIHCVAASNTQITNIPVNIERGLDNEQRNDHLLHSSNSNVEAPQWRFDELGGRYPTPSKHLLQRWAYETSNTNITFAEGLEKSNWDATRMQRL